MITAPASPPARARASVGRLVPRQLCKPFKLSLSYFSADEFADPLGVPLILNHEHDQTLRCRITAFHPILGRLACGLPSERNVGFEGVQRRPGMTANGARKLPRRVMFDATANKGAVGDPSPKSQVTGGRNWEPILPIVPACDQCEARRRMGCILIWLPPSIRSAIAAIAQGHEERLASDHGPMTSAR